MHVSGEVVSFRIYDTGGEIDLSKVKKIFGQKPEQEKIIVLFFFFFAHY